MMPPLTGLGIGRIVIFYIYAAPTALSAEILRLQNVQTPEGGAAAPPKPEILPLSSQLVSQSASSIDLAQSFQNGLRMNR
jgi:hypothetical protein